MRAEPDTARAFLATRHRLAVVGASPDRRQFGNTIYRELRDHGYDVVAVHRTAAAVEGAPAYPDLDAVPGRLDGVVVMVDRHVAVDVVRDAVAREVPAVWLFKGIGGPGAASEEAVRLCEDEGVDVVAGACPLMFLEPVGWFHRIHRALRY